MIRYGQPRDQDRSPLQARHGQGFSVQAAASLSTPVPAPAAERRRMRACNPAFRRAYVYCQRHRLFLHLGRLGSLCSPIPPTTRAFGPSWANSLFEDNAEYGYGMYLGSKPMRERLAGYLDEIYADACDKTKAAIDAWKATYEDGSANRDATDELIAVLEGAPECPNTPLIKKVLAEKEFLRQEVRLDVRRRRLGVRHRLWRSGSCPRFRQRREHPCI